MEPVLLTASGVASQLNLPISWVKSEARAGRLPHLKDRRQLRFKLQAVQQALLQRAAQEPADRVAPATRRRRHEAAREISRRIDFGEEAQT